jgi:hypothetical protein
MSEDPVDHGGLLDQRDQAQTAATARAGQHVHPEGAAHQYRPALASRVPSREIAGSLTPWFVCP